MTFDEWYEKNAKYMNTTDFEAWMLEAWEAGAKAEQDNPCKGVEQEPVAERFEKTHANGDVWITTIAAAAIARNAAPVRTKDLTEAEIATLVQRNTIDGKIMPFALCEAVIVADREKNK